MQVVACHKADFGTKKLKYDGEFSLSGIKVFLLIAFPKNYFNILIKITRYILKNVKIIYS